MNTNTYDEIADKIVSSVAAVRREKVEAAKSAAITAENMVPLKKFATAINGALKKHPLGPQIQAEVLPWTFDGKTISGGLSLDNGKIAVVVTPGESAVTINGARTEQQNLFNAIGKEVHTLLSKLAA